MQVDPIKNAVIIGLIATALAAAIFLELCREMRPPKVLPLGTKDCPEAVFGTSVAARALFCTGRLPVNLATEQDLVLIEGIGDARASAIVNHREKVGPLGSVSDLERLRGLGPATVARIEPFLDFSVPP